MIAPIDALKQLAEEAAASAAELDPRIPRDADAFLDKYQSYRQSPTWRAVTRTTYGLALDDDDREALRGVCGHDQPLAGGYTEVVVAAGRMAAKSSTAAGLIAYEAAVLGVDHMKFITPGTPGYALLISGTLKQGSQDFAYVKAMFESAPELRALLDGDPVVGNGGGELRLKSGIVIAVLPMSKTSIRGFRVVAAVVDEIGWWATADESAQQDVEVLNALRGCMLPPSGAPPRRLFAISTPGAKAGYLWTTVDKHLGVVGAPVLVAHGSSIVWNPAVDRAFLERERARDPRNCDREYGAMWIDAVSAWCPAEAIDAATIGRTAEPIDQQADTSYFAAVDLAFKRDSSVLAIGHTKKVIDEKDPAKDHVRFVCDGFWRFTPTPGVPLDVQFVVREMCRRIKSYGTSTVVGDQYCSVPLTVEFAAHGVQLVERTATISSKFEAFSRLREALIAGRCSIPAFEPALRELRELQERVTGGGNVQISSPRRAGSHGDCASALGWLFATAVVEPRYVVGTIEEDWMSRAMDGNHAMNGGGWGYEP